MNSFFNALKNSIKFNASGHYCPDCVVGWNAPTIFAHILYDEKYHKFKIYAKCDCCNNVTPAFDALSKVNENIEDLWARKENVLLFIEGA